MSGFLGPVGGPPESGGSVQNVNVVNTPGVVVTNTPDVNIANVPHVEIVNVPDVDVVSLPSIPAGTNTIGKVDQGTGGASA
jgi:hypothetical protein